MAEIRRLVGGKQIAKQKASASEETVDDNSSHKMSSHNDQRHLRGVSHLQTRQGEEESRPSKSIELYCQLPDHSTVVAQLQHLLEDLDELRTPPKS